ncbi:MAG TPA: hypothetical protein VNH11_17690 [Pirellulales bacterium]|nr:hypothetical protein [Pirellulales bacterium]
MTDLPDPNIFTPQPAQETPPGFDVAKAIREASEPISVGHFPDSLFDELTKAVTVPSRFAELIPQEEPPLDLSAYPAGKPRYDNIRARLFLTHDRHNQTTRTPHLSG